jgi:tRNA nucleotidyltransferase (CCA-adding enzyme)
MRRADVPEPVLAVCRRLGEAGFQAYVVGGCVRDALRGVPCKDWDVATSADPEIVQRLFKRTIPTGVQHGTVTVLAPAGDEPMPIEVTTFRGEGAYTDARRPDSVTFGVTLEEDLSRRDFTMNAIAFDPVAETIVDPFGGRTDLDGRLIRAVGDPVARFREDGLRVMRGIRFAAVLEFALEPETEAAIPKALEQLARVSAERVRDELLKLMAARHPSRGLEIAERTGILKVILPELSEGVGLAQNRYHTHDVWRHTLATVDGTEGDPIRRMAALLHDVAKPRTAAPKPDAPGEFTFYRHDQLGAELSDEILRRLKFSNKERERVVGVVANHMFWYTPDWSDATVRRFVRRVGEDGIQDLFAVRAGDVIGRGRAEDPEVELGELRRRVDQVLSEDQALSIGDLAIKGPDVMAALGVGPGPIIGEVLRALLEMVIEDPALNEREALLALIPEVAKKLGRG